MTDIVERLRRYSADIHPMVAEATDEIERLRRHADALAVALTECGVQFRFYENEHLKKGTQDGDEKAYRNKQFAEKCEDALSTYRAAYRKGEG